MSLLDCFLNILSDWKSAFPAQPSYRRAVHLALASVCVVGRACISRLIGFLGMDQKDWSANYKLFSRTNWSEPNLFDPIIKRALPFIDEPYISVAFDDTKLKKTGKKIKTAFYQRDPMSPPFHVNLILGLRFLQGSLLVPMYMKNDQPPRALPILFKEVPVVKKPGKYATEAEVTEYESQKKKINLSIYFMKSLAETREALDRAGGKDKILIATVDNGYCNRTCMDTPIERTCVLARARKSARLCFRATGETRKMYGDYKFTPEEVRKDDSKPWEITQIYHGGKWREVRYKEVKNVLWQTGTKLQPLRLIVIAPVPYRLTKTGRLYYREPAYLLCQATEIDTDALIQKYFDRWQIEVNHREEKDTLGVGQAQVRSDNSVPRQPTFVVAAYSAMMLAGIICFEDKRGDMFMKLPKWRRNAKRPSCLDLMHLLRKEIQDKQKEGLLKNLEIDLVKAVLKSAA